MILAPRTREHRGPMDGRKWRAKVAGAGHPGRGRTYVLMSLPTPHTDSPLPSDQYGTWLWRARRSDGQFFPIWGSQRDTEWQEAKQNRVLSLSVGCGYYAAKSLQSCPTLCDPRECSPPGSSVRGLLQARILEWVAKPSSRGSSLLRDRTHISYISCTGRWVLLPLVPPGNNES